MNIYGRLISALWILLQTVRDDAGKVMGQLKARVQGRADMGALSAQVKRRLAQ